MQNTVRDPKESSRLNSSSCFLVISCRLAAQAFNSSAAHRRPAAGTPSPSRHQHDRLHGWGCAEPELAARSLPVQVATLPGPDSTHPRPPASMALAAWDEPHSTSQGVSHWDPAGASLAGSWTQIGARGPQARTGSLDLATAHWQALAPARSHSLLVARAPRQPRREVATV